MRRLRLYFIAFFALLAVPCSILLVRSYANLRQESFYFYRKTAEGLVEAFQQRFRRMLEREERRPFTQYRYIHVADQPVPEQEGLNVSPLAAFPVESEIPGLLGYFQIDPDGSFHTPLVPDENSPVIQTVSDLEARRQLRDRLASLLSGAEFQTVSSRRADTRDTDQAISALMRNLESEVDRYLENEYSSGNRAEGLLVRPGPETSASSEAVEPQLQTSSPRQAVIFDSQMDKAKLDRLEKKEEADQLREGLADQELGRLVGEKATDEKTRRTARSRDQVGFADVAAVPASEGVTAEVDPFRVMLLEEEWFTFYRRVWWQERRYIQGFVARVDGFLEGQLDPLLQNVAVPEGSAYLSFYRGEPLPISRPAAVGHPKPLLLLNSALRHPLNDVHLAITVPELPRSPGARVVDALAAFLALLVIGGVFGLYRLTATQMELSQKKSDFVAAVTHELKTPLASIRMYGEMLVEGWVHDEKSREAYYRHIHEEAERLSRLIQNVLRLAELDRGEWKVNPTVQDPVAFVQETAERLTGQVEKAGFKLVTEVQGDPRPVRLDSDALTQVLINLIDNSLKFSKDAENRKVVLTVSQDGEECCIRVRDFGPGIPKRELERIFDRFYRIDSELTRATRGTGIGLALVKLLVKAMGAGVSAANCQPGAEFTIRFPAA